MNYLTTAFGRPDGSDVGQSQDGLIHVDGMYKTRIESLDGVDVFEGYIPEDFSFSLANNWDPMGGLAEAVPGVANVAQLVDSISKRSLGGSQKVKYASPQTWSGPSYLSISLPFELSAWKSGAQDVHKPMVNMLRLITPELDDFGRTRVPGPSPILTAIDAYSKGQNQDVSSLIENRIFKCTIGNFFSMSPCIITDVQVAVDGQFEHDSGLPISSTMNVDVQSYWPVSRDDIDTWFKTETFGI
tara:strand:+ start:80029 stop:80757 length:729 start_codon:yes stop_codon:yes gene_type:complete